MKHFLYLEVLVCKKERERESVCVREWERGVNGREGDRELFYFVFNIIILMKCHIS